MEVILLDEVRNLGNIGDLIKVKDGYGRNYLIPTGKAISASVKNKRRLEHEKRIAQARLQKAKAEAATLSAKLSGTPIRIACKVGEQDKLYGSVTVIDIRNALADAGFDLDRKNIRLDEPIKALGDYKISVRLPGDVAAEIQVSVVAEG